MIKKKIPNSELQELLSGKTYSYPKYATQIMNLANQNAQGTRPKVVGQMSDLIQEFQGSSLLEWQKWYLEQYPNAIDNATDKVFAMISLFKEVMPKIDKDIVRQWIEELVIVKTFSGLKFQEAILKTISFHLKKPYRLAKPEEESTGIDGYIGNSPLSIKPITYKAKMTLIENISIPMVFYSKNKSDITIEFNEQDFQ